MRETTVLDAIETRTESGTSTQRVEDGAYSAGGDSRITPRGRDLGIDYLVRNLWRHYPEERRKVALIEPEKTGERRQQEQ